MPLFVGIADGRTGGTDQLPANEIGDRDVLGALEARGVQGGIERLLHVQHVGADRQPGHVVVQQPGMGGVRRPGRPGPLLDPGPPAQPRVGQGVVGVHPVDHQLDQLRAAGHVGVERHRPDPEPTGHLPHRQGGQAFGVGDADAGVDHLGQAGLRPWAAARRRGGRIPQQLDCAAALRRARTRSAGVFGGGVGIGHRGHLPTVEKMSVPRACLNSVQCMLILLGTAYGVDRKDVEG